MAKADIAALLALAAAVFIAIGDVVHQRSARQVTDAEIGHTGLFLRLLRDRAWWLGSAVAAIGFALQAAALGLGSVLLVQAVLVTSLLFALPLSARAARRRVSGPEWTWAVLLAASVVVIVTVGNPTAGQSRASPHGWAVVAAVLVPLLALGLLAARRFGGRARAVLLALVSGALWGVFAVLTKTVVGLLGAGIPALLRAPELYAWVVVAVAGTAWQQSSFRAGAITASLPAMTIAEPLVASVLGIALLGETLHPGESGWLVLAAAIATVVVATVALARGEARTTSAAGAG